MEANSALQKAEYSILSGKLTFIIIGNYTESVKTSVKHFSVWDLKSAQ